MRFEKVLVIGSGKIACDCVNTLHTKAIDLEVIESKASTISMLKGICSKKEIPYSRLQDKTALNGKLSEETGAEKRILIVSANNEYLFPEEIIKRENVVIINFHYSYLPDYRGMNIPTWVIYNEEPYTGVTWHYVNDRIDDGEILVQKKIELSGKETAFQIVRQGMEAGIEAFNEMIDRLLSEPITGKANTSTNMRCYTRRQIPDNGFLDISKPAAYIFRLLRAFDYNGAGIFPCLKTVIEDKVYEIQKYRISEKSLMSMGGGFILETRLFNIP